MPFTKKLAVYTIGFLLGLAALWGLGLHKSQPTRTKPAYRRPIQEQDLKSPKPVDPLLAFYYIEQPKPYGLKRVLVYDRVGPSGFIRVEEKLTQDQPRRVLNRQVYIANQLEIEVDPTVDAPALEALLAQHRLRLIPPLTPPPNHRHTVQLPSPSFPMYHQSFQALKKEPSVLHVYQIAFP